jgi:large subunit ribosomal protein L9
MKLILTREVAGLGLAGDVVDVKDGYGRNFLLPGGKAIVWSAGGEKQIVAIKRARTAREIRDREHALEIKGKLEAAPITVKAKVGGTGSLFGSVTDKDVVAAIKAATALDVDRHRIKVAHIKKLGNYSVKVSLTNQVSATVALVVVAA